MAMARGEYPLQRLRSRGEKGGKGVRNLFPWVRINDDQHQWGLLLHITGDPRLYGRVYVGTHGRGIVHGDPAR